MQATTLVVIPTYNEESNLGRIVPAVLAALPDADLWIVDDNSPDGTGRLADELATQSPRMRAFHRPGKAGLGTAYVESFKQALDRPYQHIVEMDADFSHDPAVLPQLLKRAQTADLVLGSRYVPGGSTPDWSVPRRMISQIGNVVARIVLSLPVKDATTGYRVFSRHALETMHLDGLSLQGYGFQIETVYQCHKAGLTITEFPIRFIDRSLGRSKMSNAIVFEALLYVFKRRFEDIFRRQKSVMDQPHRVGDHYEPTKSTDGAEQHVQP